MNNVIFGNIGCFSSQGNHVFARRASTGMKVSCRCITPVLKIDSFSYAIC